MFLLLVGILGVSNLPCGTSVVEDIVSFDWHVITKYYTATVRLCTTQHRTIGDKTFADSVQAVILTFDPDQVK